MTVTRSPIAGESTKETVKTIAQGRPDRSGEPVVTTLVCFFILHTRLRVHQTPGFPCALHLEWLIFVHSSGALCRERCGFAARIWQARR
jgi:hypothetical protein